MSGTAPAPRRCLYHRIRLKATDLARHLATKVMEQWDRYFYRVLQKYLMLCTNIRALRY
jgi:hypothetical protein